MKQIKPATLIGLAQNGVIIMTFLVTAGFMKIHGYPDSGAFPMVCLIFRHGVFGLIFISGIWTLFAAIADSRGSFLLLTDINYYIIGLIILSILSTFAVGSMFLALVGPPMHIRAL